MATSLLTAPAGQATPDLSGKSLNLQTPLAAPAGQAAPDLSGKSLNILPTTTTPPPAPDHTMDAAAISSNQGSGGITFPQNQPDSSKTASDANGANVSVPSPIPTAESIINTSAAPTPAETKQKSILDRIAGLIGGNKGQQDLTNTAETNAGLPTTAKTINDLSTQLQGLNDQSTALANEAQYTIPNQVQLDNQGSGVTKASTSARSADALRLNQIQQGRVATQALTVKAALYAAQGNYNLAKDAADKAATAQYQDEQQKIDYQKALLDANAPQMTKEEKAQADIQTAKLADRQTQINNAQEDKKTAIAMATAAITNNPNDPAAHYAAQQALAESNQQQPDLAKIFSLVGRYQSDPMATQKAILDMQATRANIANTLANTAKTKADTGANGNPDAAAVDKQNALQNAADQQTQKSNYQTILAITQKVGATPETITEANIAKMSNADQVSIGKALGRMQNPDLARAGGDPGNALEAVGLPGKAGEFLHQTFTGQLYDPSKIVDAIKTATALINQRNGGGGILRSPDGKSQVNVSDLTQAQITEAKNAGWK